VIRRWVENPLIALEDLPVRASDIWNAGVIRVDGEYIMLITVESLAGQYSIYQARGRDGKHFCVLDEPFMAPCPGDHQRGQYESLGIRAPRITPLDGTYYITYVAEGDHGLRLALGRTDDFKSWEHMGYISQVDNKNGVLLPAKIHGRYALLERPREGGSIWVSYSDDLVFWGDTSVVMTPRDRYWDMHMVGASAPPIEIDEGWLLIYYGEKFTSAGPLIRLGAAILARDDPSHVVARSNIPILSPREFYERVGDVPNMVFSCGLHLEDDGLLNVFYGASDSCICLGQASLEHVVRICLEGQTGGLPPERRQSRDEKQSAASEGEE
jgi:predicted GH43/DUF377 family glycosyl hydrolase